MADTLTDRQFWKDYWSHKDVRVEVGPKYLFHQQFRSMCDSRPIRNSIEIGGFPGYFSVFLAKHCGVEPTLLDYYVDHAKVRELTDFNGLERDRVRVIETDFLSFETDVRYDLVFSCGLIEHFENFDELIERHVNLLSPGGQLFIELPNFLGLNGWVQQRWDPENLAKHNLKSMDVGRLHEVLNDLPLQDVSVGYEGRFGTWLERLDEQPTASRLAYKTVNKIGRKLSKLAPKQTRAFSPYIVMTATKAIETQARQRAA